MGLEKITAKTLRKMAKELRIDKISNMKKSQLAKEVQAALDNDKAIPLKTSTKQVRVTRNNKHIITIDGVLATYRWARENHICNQGWVRRSLKNREATKPGFKFHDAGYLFEYVDK